MISFTAPLKIWTFSDGTSHFMRVPQELAGEIKAQALLVRRGFGSVRVEVTIGDVTWRTSVFPSKETGGYFLPIKIDVVRKTGIAPGNDVTVALTLL